MTHILKWQMRKMRKKEMHYLVCWEGDIAIIILKAVIPHEMSVD